MPETLNSERSVESGPIRCSSWRALLSPPLSGAENMACDVALMDRARATGEAVVRVYSWRVPTLSLGRNQKVAGLYDAASLARLNLDVVRRPTGGRTILHDHEITYSVTAPASSEDSLNSAYSWINSLLLAALRSLGVAAEIAEPESPGAVSWTSPCFALPARGEIIVGGRKLVGSAQYRHDGALLQHGSILVRDDQSLLSKLAAPGDELVPAPATLGELLGDEPSPEDFGAVLRDALHAGTGKRSERLEQNEVEALTARHIELFRDERWTWRA